jgi:nicotinamidase-related amidase
MRELPVPTHFDSSRVGEVWRVEYEDRAHEAREWAREHDLTPAAQDGFRVCLLAVDVQNTFCIPDFELFVAGRSGRGAVDDSRRLVEFAYRNLATITQVLPSLDTHQAMQVFHAIWLVDEHGNHPDPYTLVSAEDVEAGRFRINPSVADALQLDRGYAERHLIHYARELAKSHKYDLTIWPYHGMLGGVGHALVSAVEEAIFFHSVARYSQPDFQVKGDNPLTEHYSMLGPEVTEGPDGDRLGEKNQKLIEKLLTFDVVVVAGQAKSHCLAWTIDDLLENEEAGVRLAERTYLLEDCTSPVVVPDLVDYTDQADAAFERYAAAGMHVVHSTDPIEEWPGVEERVSPQRTYSGG